MGKCITGKQYWILILDIPFPILDKSDLPFEQVLFLSVYIWMQTIKKKFSELNPALFS